MAKLDYLILGPLEVKCADEAVQLGGARQRSVLALLLLRANEVVSADRLIDDLWGERPPDDAATALQQHVSRLRKQLGPDARILTRAPGYVLELEPGQLDLLRFRSAGEEGRRRMAAGDAAAAAESLRDALAMWRGPPLAGLEGDFVRDAVAEIEDERLGTLEQRLHADLALARHAELVPELTALVRAHPLRDRLREQLMLALYRSGRQAEALEAYSSGRRMLADELGLEPGPELRALQQAILTQDPSVQLAAKEAPRDVPGATGSPRPAHAEPDHRQVRAPRRRGAVAAVATGAALIIAAAIVLPLVLAGREEPAAPVPAAAVSQGGVLLEVDPATGTVTRRIAAGRTPAAVAATPTAVWLVDADARTVIVVDAATGASETLSVGQTPIDVASGPGGVWVTSGRPLKGAQFVGPVATAVTRLDSATRTARADVELPAPKRTVTNLVEDRLAISRNAVWAITGDSTLVRLDARTAAITGASRALGYAAVAAGGDRVWAVSGDGTVASLGERDARFTRRASLRSSSVAAIAVGAGSAWVTSPSDGLLWRVGESRPAQVGAITLTPGITDVAVGAGFVWVVNPTEGTLIQIEPTTATVVRTVPVGGRPHAVSVAGDRVWVVATSDAGAAVSRQVAGVTALPATACEDVIAGPGGVADVLIASDLPLQGGTRLTTTQMAQAITFVLRERDFRAGRFRVAYQSCDDSSARTGRFDEAKCAANAHLYGDNRDLIGVVGTFNSACALVALPILNRARGGAVAMVSPSNSLVGLTRSGPGTPPGLPASLYPTGRRNYARVFPTDDLQGAALALLAKSRGHSRVFVLDDGEPGYGVLMASGFDIASRNLGLDVVGRATWDPRAAGFAALVDRVAGSSATAVFLGGLLDSGGARVARALRARVDRSVELFAPDGFTPLGLYAEQAGSAAIGTHVSIGGTVTDRLPPAGAAFVQRFGRTQRGASVQPSAVYAAQAVSVLLDAIARSDGTRGSVVQALFTLRVQNGLLGSFAFTDTGDITESPVTILRVRGPGASDVILGTDGGSVEEVVRPSQKLVALGG